MAYMKYLEDTELFSSEAIVTEMDEGVGIAVPSITLDETIFYPQGGGQPTDIGTISSGESVFAVDRVSYRDGEIYHSGTVRSGSFRQGDIVTLQIDGERRMRNAKLHTGGHLVMTAVDRLLRMPAVKGYHFPDGPYVEFMGVIDPDRREAVLASLQSELDSLVAEDSAVSAEFTTPEDLRRDNIYVPAEIPAGKPTRVVVTSGYRSPCGGTHVKLLGELTGLTIRGIKSKSGHTRISYLIEGL